ncbi:hypothetical protein J6590_056613 [Homalodisca vitripennis]|nr:hypothetical protein J6590_056613 [Homalodisca vitripennis]
MDLMRSFVNGSSKAPQSVNASLQHQTQACTAGCQQAVMKPCSQLTARHGTVRCGPADLTSPLSESYTVIVHAAY